MSRPFRYHEIPQPLVPASDRGTLYPWFTTSWNHQDHWYFCHFHSSLPLLCHSASLMTMLLANSAALLPCSLFPWLWACMPSFTTTFLGNFALPVIPAYPLSPPDGPILVVMFVVWGRTGCGHGCACTSHWEHCKVHSSTAVRLKFTLRFAESRSKEHNLVRTLSPHHQQADQTQGWSK